MKPELGEISPDGSWSWDGTQWVPVGDGRQRSALRRRMLAWHFADFVVPVVVSLLLALLGAIVVALFSYR